MYDGLSSRLSQIGTMKLVLKGDMIQNVPLYLYIDCMLANFLKMPSAFDFDIRIHMKLVLLIAGGNKRIMGNISVELWSR